MAARKAGLESIPALVLDEALKPDEAIEARLIENLQREDLDPLDEAEAYQALQELGYSLAEIGRRLGKSRPYVSMRVKLLRARAQKVQVAAYTHKIGHGNLRSLEKDSAKRRREKANQRNHREANQNVALFVYASYEWANSP
jgi:ParB family chromosome partitioning protein